jgi:hypothetical protein
VCAVRNQGKPRSDPTAVELNILHEHNTGTAGCGANRNHLIVNAVTLTSRIMPTQEPYPDENPGAPNRIREWWKKRSALKQILLCVGAVIAVVAAWHFFSQHQAPSREAAVADEVKTSMQNKFDTDRQFSQYHLVVSKVNVMHKSGNEYEGLAVVHTPKNVDHNVAVHVIAEGNRIMWQSDPGAFTWAALE